MKNLPKTTEEQLLKLAEIYPMGSDDRKWLEHEAREMGFDWDNKYDDSFRRHEIGVERENLENN